MQFFLFIIMKVRFSLTLNSHTDKPLVTGGGDVDQYCLVMGVITRLNNQ